MYTVLLRDSSTCIRTVTGAPATRAVELRLVMCGMTTLCEDHVIWTYTMFSTVKKTLVFNKATSCGMASKFAIPFQNLECDAAGTNGGNLWKLMQLWANLWTKVTRSGPPQYSQPSG